MADVIISNQLTTYQLSGHNQQPMPILGCTMSACSQEKHVATMDTSKPEDCLEVIQSSLFRSMNLTSRNNVVQSLRQSIFPDNCIQIRSAAKSNCLNDLADQCDKFIGSMFAVMYAQEEFLSLPRVQVSVKTTSDVFEFGSDPKIIDDLLPKVVEALETNCTTHLEETAIEMYLADDLSVTLRSSNLKGCREPAKREGFQDIGNVSRSPAIKLSHGCSFECMEDFNKRNQTRGDWVIVSSQKMSELSVICVIKNSTDLVLLNVSLVPNKLPVSPTTGISFINASTLFAQMGAARSGFGVTSLEDGLICSGGFNRDGCTSSTEIYDFRQNNWKKISDMNKKRARFGLVKLDGTVYAFGGSDGQHELASMETFNLQERKWTKLDSNMTTPRSCFGATTLDSCVYVIGGLHYSTPLKSAEMYNPSTRNWVSLPSMHTSRRDVAVTGCNGKVYAIGGQTSGWNCLASVEVYNPLTREWSKGPSMKIPRRNATAVSIDGRIYVIGGYNGTAAVRQVEVFYPVSNTWSNSSQMNVKRSYPAATVIDQSVYVVGGFSNFSFLNSMERLDIQTNQWTSFV